MTDMKPCPHCGCDVVDMETDHTVFAGCDFGERYPEPVRRQRHGHRARCGRCGCQTCWWHYKSEAVDAWNARAELAERDKAVPVAWMTHTNGDALYFSRWEDAKKEREQFERGLEADDDDPRGLNPEPLYTHPPRQAVPDGYAVILSDKKSSPTGFWFAGAFIERESAEKVAAGNGKRATIKPFYFIEE